MLIFTIRRLNLFIFTMLVLTLLSFSLSFLFPGDSIINITGAINATPYQLEKIQQSYQTDSNIFLAVYCLLTAHNSRRSWYIYV